MQDDEGNWLIPTEVLLHILKFLDDRGNVAMTCTKLNQLVRNIEKNQQPLKITTNQVSSDDSENFDELIAHFINSWMMTRFLILSSLLSDNSTRSSSIHAKSVPCYNCGD